MTQPPSPYPQMPPQSPYPQAPPTYSQWDGPRHIPPGRSLRVLGVAVQVALLITALALLWQIRELVNQRSLGVAIADHSRPVSLAEARAADAAAHSASVIRLVCFIGTGILFLVWFWIARTNAQRYIPHVHVRARAWAFWGWVVPIVNFWFPYQIARDIIRADRAVLWPGPTAGSSPYGVMAEAAHTSRVAPTVRTPGIVRVWWALWLIGALVQLDAHDQQPTTPAGIVGQITWEIAAAAILACAAVAAIFVVGLITSANDDRRASLLNRGTI